LTPRAKVFAVIFRSPWPPLQYASASVGDAVLAVARQFGGKPALIEGETGRTLTYRQLADGAEHVAAGLAHAGLKPGQPLALALPNSIDFALAFFGALRAGAWVVPINPIYTAAEMEHQIHDSGARFLVTVPERAAELAPAVDSVFEIGGRWNELLECAEAPPEVHSSPGDLAMLPYSSGTTGKPKGVMLTHDNVLANVHQFIAATGIEHQDVLVNVFPLYHVAGLNCILNSHLAVGATVVLMRRFDLEGWLALIEQYRGTAILIPPPVVLAIVKSPAWDRFRLDSLQGALCGAAPLGADLQKAFEDRTGLVLRQAWGMTEAAATVAADVNHRVRRKHGSCGYLSPSIEARVVDVATLQERGPDETGEIWLRGPNIMQGYWKQPAATADTLVSDGWMRTGDIGYLDSDGCIFLVDRLKELIKYNAQQVAPAELEDIVQSHPDVLDAAVIGAPDEAAGEIPMAFVVRRDGAHLDAAELMSFVAARVAPHKKIRAVEFVDEIPKSPAGKILRRVLKEVVRAR
jgi:acyl-CoA synthetase (AMP-forming)/AMP-acid ligase II